MGATYKYAGKNSQSHRKPGFVTQFTLLQLLCRRHKVQKETSAAISFVYVFCMEIVDFFGWNLFEMIRDILQSTQI